MDKELLSNKTVFEENLKQLIKSILICRDNHFIVPCLILIYSGIDVLAWFNCSESQIDTTRSNFEKWVQKYLLPDSQLNCNANDLYAARCSILHTLTAESRLSREGAAMEIYYAWGTGDEDKLQKALDNSSIPKKVKAVHLNKLFNAFIKGIESFVLELENDTQKAEIVYNRSNKMFGNIFARE